MPCQVQGIDSFGRSPAKPQHIHGARNRIVLHTGTLPRSFFAGSCSELVRRCETHESSSQSPHALYNTVYSKTNSTPRTENRKSKRRRHVRTTCVGRSAASSVGRGPWARIHTQAQFHLTYKSMSQVLHGPVIQGQLSNFLLINLLNNLQPRSRTAVAGAPGRMYGSVTLCGRLLGGEVEGDSRLTADRVRQTWNI